MNWITIGDGWYADYGTSDNQKMVSFFRETYSANDISLEQALLNALIKARNDNVA